MFAFISLAVTWLGRIGLAAFAINEIRNLTSEQKTNIETASGEAKKAGVTDDDQKQLIAATTYDQVEKDGKSPDEFWNGLPQNAKDNLKFSPESLRTSMGRTKFLGIASSLAWAGAMVAGGVASLRGVPIALKTLVALRDARAAGATASALLVILEEGKIAGLARVWVPGFIAGIASAAGWLTAGLSNNLNDAFLWGRIFLGQAADDFDKAAKQRLTGAAGVAVPTETPTHTRITVSKTTGETQIAVGTIFQSTIKDTEAFRRVVDDEITSADDLKNDAQLNLNRWLQSLPGRLSYEIRITLNPLDEYGNKRTGTWAMLMIAHRNIQGLFTPLAAIALGPIEPTKYTPTSKDIKSITYDIPKLLTAEEIMEFKMPTENVRIVDPKGRVVPIQFQPTPATPTPPAPTYPEAPTPPVSAAGQAFVSFAGSPDVFFRQDGKYLPQAEAIAKRVNLITDVEQILSPRPEVTKPEEFAAWSGKDLTRFPVPVGGFPKTPITTPATPPVSAPTVPPPPVGVTVVPYGFYTTSVNGRPYAEILPATNVPFGYSQTTFKGFLSSLAGGLQWDINNTQSAIDRGAISSSGLAKWNESGGTVERQTKIARLNEIGARVGTTPATDSDVAYLKAMREFDRFTDAQVKAFLSLSPGVTTYGIGPVTATNIGGVYSV